MGKHALCRHWLNGNCNKGSECSWAHGRAELTESNYQDRPTPKRHYRPSFRNSLMRKTTLCQVYEKHGSCRYGDNCRFAHGEADLKKKPDLNNRYVKRILELEKENTYLKQKIAEMTSFAPQVAPQIVPSMVSPVVDPNMLQQTLSMLLGAQKNRSRSRSRSRHRKRDRRSRRERSRSINGEYQYSDG